MQQKNKYSYERKNAYCHCPAAPIAGIPLRAEEENEALVRELQEVVVTARNGATKLEGSTLVTTIPGTAFSDLGTALDVLGQLPMMKADGATVSVIGKGNVEIYIDGRLMRDASELQQILSTNLQKVELLMAPGAEYASTTDAVLKITTRRNFGSGLSVMDRLQVERTRRWSAMDYLALGYREGPLEFFVDASINRNNNLQIGSTRNLLIYEGRETIVGSSQRSSSPSTAGVIKGGFNFARGAQSLGAYYRFNPERGDFRNSGSEWLDQNPAIEREIAKRIRAHSHLVSVYYENTFAEKYLLHFDGNFRRSLSASGVATTYPESENPEVRSTDERTSTLWAGKLSLRFPLGPGEMAVGTQDSYTQTDLDYRMLNPEVGQYIPSALTSARQTSAALFASWSRRFGRFSLSAGARYEFVDYDFKVNGRRDPEVSRRDNLLSPDLSLGYELSEEAQLNLSYRMTTVKPPYAQLTGALNYVGAHEIEGGNPALRDERMNNLQLMGIWRGFMLQADFIHSRDTYAYVKRLYPADNLQLLMQPINIGVSALSIYLVWGQPVGRWTPNVTAGMYRQWLRLGSEAHDRPIFSYYFDNTFALGRGWTLTANLGGRTAGDMHTNRFGATWLTVDASVGKTFFNKALTVKLSATDIFNSANDDWTMRTFGVFVDKRQSYDRRGVALSVTYNFRPHKSAYKGTSANPEEMNRL